MTAPTSPKPATPADPNDLRTALTKLADDAEEYGPGAWVAGEVRALLAAHPTEPQAGPLAEYRDAVARNRSAASWMRDDFLTDMDEWMTTHPAPVSDTRREDDELVETVARALSRSEHPGVQAYIDARAVLAVLPAPPVVWTRRNSGSASPRTSRCGCAAPTPHRSGSPPSEMPTQSPPGSREEQHDERP